MAQTTTAVNACNAVIKVDKSNGAATDVSGSANVVRMRFRNRYSQWKHYDSDKQTRVLIGQELQADITVLYSTTDDEGLDILRDWCTGALTGTDARTLTVYIPDDGEGSDYYQAEVVPINWGTGLEAKEGGPVEVNVSFRSTDGYTVAQVTTTTSTSTTSSSTSTTTTSTSTTTTSISTSTSISTTSSSTSVTQSTSTTTTL